MARVTHVKRAQQRYATKPVIDPATGEPKVVPVLRKDGTPKTTKNGRPVTMRVTERDLDNPLPMPKCDKCGATIEVGQPYKWIEPQSGVRNRCASCPTWQVWEYSSSLSALIAQIQSDGPDGSSFSCADDATQWASDKAQEIRDLAEQKRESASNIEDGFGHSTYQSDELNETADNLESWADELENVDLPEFPEEEEQDCEECEGTGEIDGAEGEDSTSCEACDGNGQVEAEEPSEDAIVAWQGEVEEALQGVLDNSPC